MGIGYTVHCEEGKDFVLNLQQDIFIIEELILTVGRGVEYIVWEYHLHPLEAAKG